jgi:DNA-directed RNA polymerase specialized sigma24 family protein
MKYKKSVLEAILAERQLGRTYKEIADKLKISIYKVKRAVLYGEEPREKRIKKRKNKKSDMDLQ